MKVTVDVPLHGSFRVEGERVPIVKVLKNALRTALWTTFRLKFTTLQDFAYAISKKFLV